MAYKKEEKFRYSYDINGTDRPTILSLPIAASTVIEYGEKVKLVGGFVVTSGGTSTAVGFAAEPHDAVSDGQKGTSIRVYASPGAVIECIPAQLMTADASSTTNTFIEADIDAHADDTFNGGTIKIVSATNLADGQVIRITDFTGATGTITTAGGEVFAEGDTALLFPPVGTILIGLTSDNTNLDMEAVGSSVMVVRVDEEKEKVFVVASLHQLAGTIA